MTKPGENMFREISEIPEMLVRIATFFEKNSEARELVNTNQFSSVVLLARGTSDNAAHFFKYLIETKLGLPCGLASPSAATMYSPTFHYRNTLVIALSQSGQSSDLLAFASAAKEGGGYILGITNDENSPLAKLSHLHLPILAGPEIAVPATKSYVGQLFISLLLATAWKKENIDFPELFQAAHESVRNDAEVELFASGIDIKKPIYVLGRGFSYPNAKEFALKLQETCLIPVQGMSSSDFLHGPIASLHSDSQVIFLAPHHLPKNSFGEAPERVRTITGRAFWIGSKDFAKESDMILGTPYVNSETKACVSDAIVFQKITHVVAVANQLDPDKPHGLSKITITK
jgi:glucosamine--fructose-6-phosphate aminotransferase (isomerizing)